MKNIVKNARGKYYAAGAAVTGASLAAPAGAMAAAQDYTDLGTDAAAEVTAAVPVGLTILALTLGIPIAIGILRRIAS